MNKLDIITSVVDPKYLPIIQASIQYAKQHASIDIFWTLISDSKFETDLISLEHKLIVSETQISAINSCLDSAEEFIYFLRGDNCIHPNLLGKISPATVGIVFPQIMSDGVLREIKIAPSCIDQSQYLVHKKAVGDTRWHEVSDADGHFISEIFNNDFQKLDEPLAFDKKAVEYVSLQEAPQQLTAGALVSPDRPYYEKEIKTSSNPLLRGTITHLNRMCGRKFELLKIEGNIVNVRPLRVANPLYKGGKGILLIFENPDQITNTFKPLVWNLPYSAEPA